jgi:hypothetical protein
MRKTIVGMALALAALAAWALPTLEEVENEVRLGHLTTAESMMNEVVAARPGGARAHYMYAEVLARNGKFAEARDQARLARQADPQVRFTDPVKFASFEQLLEREQRASSARAGAAPALPALPAPPAAAPTPAGGVPAWIWLALIAVAAILVWRGFSRSRAAAASAGLAAGPNAMAPGVPPGYGPVGPASPGYGPGSAYGGAPSRSSGMLGTGLAAAGGFAAGMLADELLHRPRVGPGAGALDNLGPAGLGSDPGDPAAAELESRPIDFGTGSGWGGDGSADAGSFDAGSFDTGGGSDWS